MSKKVLIVGGVAGGASTAARLRRNDETAQIILFEKGEYISFANCGLPYYIGGTIEERSALLLQTPEAMKARFEIDVRVRNEVVSINREEKKVVVKDLAKNVQYEESYDILVLSPGSTPIKPPIPGIDAPNVFSLWNIPDTDAIKHYVTTYKPKRAVVVGGGFIGLEMAENLHDLKMDVTLVEMADQVMAPIDFDMAEIVHKHMKDKNVNLILKNGVKEFVHHNGVTTVSLNDGTQVEADVVIFSIGIKPQGKLAAEAGLKMNERGGIVSDEFMLTSDPSIYAVGDAIEVTDYLTGDKTMVPLAGPANRQGRIAANNISGAKEVYKGTQGTAIAKVFDLTVASTGLSEKSLKRLGKKVHEDYEIAFIHAKSHAGYYPGAITMTLKVLFSKGNLQMGTSYKDEKGKVLGAQIVGYDGVDKRMDVLATAIRFCGTIYDLKDLELAYAPPYSSAKDPVNMIGFTAENILNGTVAVMSAEEVHALSDGSDKGNTLIIDVRDPMERDMGLIEGSINMPLNLLRAKMDELDKSKTIVLYCAIGLRGYIAARMLMQHGFEKVFNLSGGYTTYAIQYCKDEASFGCGSGTCSSGGGNVTYKDNGEVVSACAPEMQEFGQVFNLNACGLQCPGPIAQVYKMMESMQKGDVLKVKATDPGFASDIGTWCRRTGNTLVESGKADKHFYATLMKGLTAAATNQAAAQPVISANTDKTMVVFSGDLDKAIASLIIANGAASMGRKVTMFYTFWGLNILRKNENVSVKKDFIANMFGMMMPRGTSRLGLSKMNMGGMGALMIRGLMKQKNVDSIETLLKSAQDSGVKMIACNMSMDLMGIKEEELIEGIDFGGVATYLGAAEESDVNLFI